MALVRGHAMCSLIVWLTLFLLGCSQEPIERRTTPTGGRGTELTEAQVSKLVENANRLFVGTLESEVLEKLGSPTYREEVRDKFPRTAPLKGFHLRYYVRRVDRAMPSDFDSFLEIWLDENRRLVRMTAHNLSGVRNLP